MLWILLAIAAVGLAMIAARLARERGRSGAAWAALAVVAGVIGQLVGFVILGLAMSGPASTTLAMTGIIWAYLSSLFGPLACMFAVIALVARLPVRVPRVGGTRWTVYRLSTKDAPGGDCVLAVERGRLVVGDASVAAGDVREIAADGECLHLSWDGGSVLVMPKDEPDRPRTQRERARFSAGLGERIRALLDGGAPTAVK